jgi:very-short-patch-repair endonuclease
MKNMQYSKLSETEQKDVIEKLYVKDKLSFAAIAKKLNTYSNKIRRDAGKFKIPIRDKSQAQSNALKQGVHKHPTKGKKRTQEEKSKIGLGIHESWKNLTESELKNRKKKAKESWDKLSDNKKANILNSALAAVRESSKTGSKLEKFLLESLLEQGYKVEFHKEQILSNTKLQIDIYLPELTTAIEVDGPSHFEPVWGQDTLARNQQYDKKKTGLIIGKGMKLIRIQQKKDFTPTRAKLIFDQLDQLLQNLGTTKDKTFTIKDK